MNTQLTKQIRGMRRGEHACLLYDNHKNQMAAVLPFVKAGLERNEACLYIANDNSEEDILSAFSSYGINVDREIKRGALIFSRNNMQTGKFEAEAMIDVLGNMLNFSQAKGFSGFRAAGEMTWVLGGACSCEQLVEYEALLNERFPAQLTGMCQYNRSRFEPEVIRGILRTHPVVIVNDKICRNLYCESTDILEKKTASDLGVNWMINNLIRFQSVEESLRTMIQVRDDFLAMASHELNTPITALKLTSEMQLRKKDVSPEDSRRFNERNLRSIRQLASIVDSMLDVTRIGKGLLELELRDDVDLVAIVNACIDHFHDTYKVHVVGDKSVMGHWDAKRLQQLVSNLLSNALKYGEKKDVTITVQGDGKNAYLSVRDQGCGIAADDQKRIFKLYERAAAALTNVGGLGIGLFISDQIVRAHGGRIWVESEPGQGSVFHIEIPLAAPGRSKGD